MNTIRPQFKTFNEMAGQFLTDEGVAALALDAALVTWPTTNDPREEYQCLWFAHPAGLDHVRTLKGGELAWLEGITMAGYAKHAQYLPLAPGVIDTPVYYEKWSIRTPGGGWALVDGYEHGEVDIRAEIPGGYSIIITAKRGADLKLTRADLWISYDPREVARQRPIDDAEGIQ